ncbi:M48 family metallopeptidase [Mariniblastus sp.]|nr:M48 family metallopeptidase [Mariniblastus sp.]
MSQPYSPYRSDTQQRRRQSWFSGIKLRLIIGAGIALFTLVSYAMKRQENPVTGEPQQVDMSVKEEIMLGIQSAPEMGIPSRNYGASQRVERIGRELVYALEQNLAQQGIEQPYKFEFHLLDNSGQNRDSVNAFALPGGQVFITEALYRSLPPDTDGALAGVLGHEIGHVLERHSAERMTSGSLIQGLTRAAGVVGGSQGSQQAANMVANLVHKSYGREQELESDDWGVKIMVYAGYNPEALITVMDVLERHSQKGGSELMSTHPRPANRRDFIRDKIGEYFADLDLDSLRD